MCGSMVDTQSPTAEITRGEKEELECGPMPNVMAACLLQLTPSVQRRSLADAHY